MLPDADLIRLHHMLDAALEVMEFARGRSRSDLDTDRMLCRAVVHDIELVGEAASRVSAATQERYHSVPWASIIAMRNRLIHGYLDIDLDRVWDTITVDLPSLIAELGRILE